MQNIDPKTFSKSKLRYLYRRVLQRIREKPKGHFVFRRMRGTWGICEFERGITVDPRKPIVPIIIHEVLHDLYPDNWEGWTLRLESKIVNVLTPYDIYILLTEFSKKLNTGVKHTRKRAKKRKVKNGKK